MWTVPPFFIELAEQIVATRLTAERLALVQRVQQLEFQSKRVGLDTTGLRTVCTALKDSGPLNPLRQDTALTLPRKQGLGQAQSLGSIPAALHVHQRPGSVF